MEEPQSNFSVPTRWLGRPSPARVHFITMSWMTLKTSVLLYLRRSSGEGRAWMSAGLAAASSGASSGKRLTAFTRWVWNSTDTMVDRANRITTVVLTACSSTAATGGVSRSSTLELRLSTQQRTIICRATF
ncbi:hypothetical protein EYF80_003162 [Liparis tanakae]|uniref:Uncharacterized protein n=1 Tax=Liparis tanakae TaxID=230148 RepID=A0A4Z2JA66_9TELE|nr:hypothetical protein EYF80_003162 [Liparis tanakae]